MIRQGVPGGIHVRVGLVGLTAALLLAPVRSGGEIPASEPQAQSPSKSPSPPPAPAPAAASGKAKKDTPAPAPRDMPKADAGHAAAARPAARRAGGRVAQAPGGEGSRPANGSRPLKTDAGTTAPAPE